VIRIVHSTVFALVIGGFASAAWGQFPSGIVGWEGQPVDLPSDPLAQEVFRHPGFSGSTFGIVPNVIGNDQNASFRSTSFGGFNSNQSCQVFFSWIDAADPLAWVRLSTFATVSIPNPALDTRGKVRFRVRNIGAPSIDGSFGLAIGVRETGVDVPQLENGGAAGPIEWVGVVPAIIEPAGGGNGLVDTSAAGDDVQVHALGAPVPAGTVVIRPGANGVIDSVAGGDDEFHDGFYLNGTNPVPIPAVVIDHSVVYQLVEWDLLTGDVTVDGVTTNGSIRAFTGDGVLSAPNDRGTLEHLIVTNVVTDAQPFIQFQVDELQFEATEADVTPAPVIQQVLTNTSTVTVAGVLLSATSVDLFKNDVLLMSAPVSAQTSVTFNLGAAVVCGPDMYTATQTSPFGTSPPSAPVMVSGAAPTLTAGVQMNDVTVSVGGLSATATLASVYADSVLIGSADPAGTTFPVPTSGLVAGTFVTATQVVPPCAESVPSNSLRVGNGNGPVFAAIAIRETGDAGPIGSMGTTGTPTSNGIEWVGVTSVISPGQAPVGTPLGLNSGFVTLTFDPATDPIVGFAGSTANGILTSANGQGTIEHLAIKVDPGMVDSSNGIFTIYVDNVINVGAGPSGEDVLIQGFESGNVGQEVMFQEPGFSGSTSAHLTATPNISAVSDQFASEGTKSARLSWFFRDLAPNRWVRLTTFNVAVGGNPIINLTKPIRLDIRLAPTVFTTQSPALVSPLEDGNPTVTVGNLVAGATAVAVLSNGTPIPGATVNPMGAASVDVPIPGGLNAGDSITATQTAAPLGESAPSEALRVGSGNGPLLVSVGLRETADTLPVGSIGGMTAGPIEWVGPATAIGGAPQGKPLGLSAGWQTFTFDPAVDPILNFSGGNGVIDVADGVQGVLEHLAFSVDASAMDASNGVIELYIDNVVNVGAGPSDEDVVLQDFESALPGAELLFQEPGFSGTTAGNLATPPNVSEVTADQSNGGLRSARVRWFFKDIAALRWVRLTTSGTSPVVDLTKPIRVDLLLQPAAATISLVSANPPLPAANPLEPGQPYRDVLDTGTTATLTAGIGGAGTINQGPIQYSPILVTFGGTPSPALTVGDIAVAATGGIVPIVTGVSGMGAGPYSITLDRPIPPGHCTTLTFTGPAFAAGTRVQYRSQPGNVSLNTLTNTQDLLDLVLALNNGAAAANPARYNVNRTGTANTQDLLRIIQLLNGVNTTEPFNGDGVASCP